IIQGAVETSRPTIDEAGHLLTVDVSVEPIHLDGDAVRLAQVFANLLNNATKYSEEGGRIRLAARREGAEAVVIVTDEGTGIAKDMLPRVFDMFTQGESSPALGGLGIGLWLAKSVVELHGGRIEAHSDGLGK